MRKWFFISVVVVMGIALVGIVLTQMYLIDRTIKEKEEQFRLNVNQIVKSVADRVQQKELKNFMNVMSEPLEKSKVRTVFGMRVIHFDERTNEEFLYSNDVVEWDFGKLKKYDSLNLKHLISRRIFSSKNRNKKVENKSNTSSEYFFKKIGHISEVDKALFYTSYKDIADRVPINERISKKELRRALQEELKDRYLDIDFEYGVYNQDSITSVKSDNFKFLEGSSFQASLFPNNEGYTPYKLFVAFPNKDSYLVSSILLMSILSGVFTVSIITAYGYTLYQSIYQRRASRIKTDFINNMTHEFKTPIATISLALEALENKKVMAHPEIQKKYFKIIGEENMRMHSQVDHILKISQFQRGRMKINMEITNLIPVIDSAIDHVRLIVESRKGKIQHHHEEHNFMVNINVEYFLNSLINIMDNAIKYSPKELVIDVHTGVDDGQIYIKISDKGMGMNTTVQKKAFQKFYRESSGNLHNVKGHGLGLTFVKYVMNLHKSEISVESKENKGSTFCITLPMA